MTSIAAVARPGRGRIVCVVTAFEASAVREASERGHVPEEGAHGGEAGADDADAGLDKG